MAQKIQKTNVCRLLDAAGIAYELIEYAVDESDLSATHVAEQLNEDVDAVFKTIVLCWRAIRLSILSASCLGHVRWT